jgi:hypothetical protein
MAICSIAEAILSVADLDMLVAVGASLEKRQYLSPAREFH